LRHAASSRHCKWLHECSRGELHGPRHLEALGKEGACHAQLLDVCPLRGHGKRPRGVAPAERTQGITWGFMARPAGPPGKLIMPMGRRGFTAEVAPGARRAPMG